VQARKVKSDGSGNETAMALNDYIDVFTGKKDEEKPLYLKKEKISHASQVFEIVVDQMPTRAGIESYNKLIDRIPDDNTIDIVNSETTACLPIRF
jgi:ABC-2 type transport system permease protein